MWITVVLFGYWCLGLCGAITQSLENIVGLRGQSVVLPCAPSSSQSTVNWKLLPRSSGNGTSEKTLYNGVGVSDVSKYKLGQYDLTVRGLELADAGTYKCTILKNGNSVVITTIGISSAELTVLDGDPICSANITPSTELREGTLIRVICHVSYLGRAFPITQCRRTQTNKQLSTNQSSITVNGTLVVNTVTTDVDLDLNGQMLNCSTYFQPTSDATQESNGTTTANIASYVRSWITPRLNVVYEPRNLRLDPDAEYYDLGATVRCTVDANPPPTLVEWHNTGNGQVIAGDQLIIDSPVFSAGNFRYRCTVENSIGRSNSTFTIRVKEGEKNGIMSAVYTIGLPVLIVILALATTTAVLVTKNRTIRRRLKNQEQMTKPSCTEVQLTEDNILSDYDEIIDNSTIAQGTTTSLNPTYVQADIGLIYNVESEVIPPTESSLGYTGLTGQLHIPTPSVYTPLESSGRPPSPLPPRDDGTTTSTTSDSNTGVISSDQSKTPKYVNQPLYIEAIAEDA